MGISYSIPLGMKWKKTYCCRCGNQLIKREQKITYQRGEPGFKTFVHAPGIGWGINIRSYTEVSYVYYCATCKREISYDDQLHVEAAQKKLGKTILSPEEIPVVPPKRKNISKYLYVAVWVAVIVLILMGKLMGKL